jgi:magnesium transporter
MAVQRPGAEGAAVNAAQEAVGERRSATDERASGTDEPDQRIRARWFDPDRTDRRLTFAEALASEPDSRHLLWIDVSGALRPGEAAALAERFELDARTRRAFSQEAARPHLALHGAYVHLRVAVQPDVAHLERVPWLDVIVARDVVISSHAEPIRFLDGLDERIEQDTTVGLLDAATFSAAMVDGAVTTYFQAVDTIEDEVDRLDARSLREAGGDHLLDELVALRRRIGRLRRLLTAHREVFTGLAAADFALVVGNDDTGDAAALFQGVSARFGEAIGAVEDSREVLLGSFDVHMTRTSQRTNEIMKVLALATVLLLPGSLIAGLLGMNVEVPLSKDDPGSFWLVVGAVVVLSIAILAVARARRWL